MDADIAALLAELDERKARRLLEEVGQPAALREFIRDRAIAFARELLAKREPTNVIRLRLRERYRVSERTAYRLFNAAAKAHADAVTAKPADLWQ